MHLSKYHDGTGGQYVATKSVDDFCDVIADRFNARLDPIYRVDEHGQTVPIRGAGAIVNSNGAVFDLAPASWRVVGADELISAVREAHTLAPFQHGVVAGDGLAAQFGALVDIQGDSSSSYFGAALSLRQQYKTGLRSIALGKRLACANVMLSSRRERGTSFAHRETTARQWIQAFGAAIAASARLRESIEYLASSGARVDLRQALNRLGQIDDAGELTPVGERIESAYRYDYERFGHSQPYRLLQAVTHVASRDKSGRALDSSSRALALLSGDRASLARRGLELALEYAGA